MQHLPKLGPLITAGHNVADLEQNTVPFHENALLGIAIIQKYNQLRLLYEISNYVCLSVNRRGSVATRGRCGGGSISVASV
jgi:hypothetical protein